MQVRYIVCAAPNPCLVSRGKKLEPSGGKSDKLIGRTRIRRTRDEEQELPPDIKGRTELEDIATSGVLVAQLWDCTGTCIQVKKCLVNRVRWDSGGDDCLADIGAVHGANKKRPWGKSEDGIMECRTD